jgi:ABC-2 type transport system ATP-binding protein
MPANQIVEFTNVSKTYSKEIGKKSYKALDNLSFLLRKGETLGLIGANGAGKSTSIRLVMDFIRPDQGSISLFDLSPRLPKLRRRIGYLPETANFPANLTLMDLLRFTAATCDLSKTVISKKSHELLEMLDLLEARSRPLRNFSKGMQQRANFAIALVNDPELLILDEPMSGLDPMGRKKIIELIFELKKAGKTILFCSHILEDVDRLVDNVLLLHKGEKLFHGTPAELATQEGKPTMAEAFVSRVKREEMHV